MTARYVAGIAAAGAVAYAGLGALAGRLGEGAAAGARIGVLLATLGGAAGLVLVGWAFERSQRAFFTALVIGILGRLFLYGAALVYVATRRAADPVAMAAGLLGMYVVFQAVEVRYALRRLRATQGAG